MTARVRYGAAARRDLAGIHEWTVEAFGEAQADAYVRQIDEVLRRVTTTPALARDASRLRPDLFKSVAGSHVAYFRYQGVDLLVVRILHGRMDPERWL